MKFDINLYIEFRKQIEKNFQLLPYGPRLVIYELLERVNPLTGIVSDINYRSLSIALEVKSAPGRVKSGIPSKQTIRNFIKTIEHECSEYFKVITKGQELQFLFPELPKIFNKFFNTKGANTEDAFDNIVENIDENSFFASEDNIEFNTEVNTLIKTVKNNNIKNKTNNNSNRFVFDKNFISDDFYPSEEIINTAKARGFLTAESPDEIQKFIKHNKSKQTQWADFNPIYLLWLERKSEYQSKLNQTRKFRSNTHEHGSDSRHSQQSTFAAVCAHHNIDQTSVWEESPSEDEFGEEGYIIPMGEDVGDVWRALY